jgi:hypothetical protein
MSLTVIAGPAIREPGPLRSGASDSIAIAMFDLRPKPNRGERRLDRIRCAQMDPVLGGVVVELEQHVGPRW